jgi:predicted dehydrogenase
VDEALQVEARHFIESVQKGTRPISDGEAGLRVVRVLEAGSHSLRLGGVRVAYKAQPERVATPAK